MSLLRLSAAAGAVLLAAGCALREPLRPAVLPPPAEVLAALGARSALSSFRSIASVEVRVPPRGAARWAVGEELGREGETYAGRAVLLWKAPDAIRLEPLSPFGAPLLVVVARGGRLRAYAPGRGRLYVGRADSQAMARLFGVPLGSGLLVRALRGGLPAPGGAGDGGERLAWDAEAGALRLELPPGAGMERRQVAWLDPATKDPRRVRIGEEGAAVEVRYGPFRRLGGARIPAWVEITGPRGESRMRIEIPPEDERAAEPFSEDLFDLPAPPGTVVVPLAGGEAR